MSRRLSAAVVFACCVAAVTVSAQSQAPAPTRSQTQPLVLEITIVEMTGAQPDEIDRIASSREHLTRLIREGKAKLSATLYVRTRLGEGFTARVGQRVPIQTATFPVFRSGGDRRNSGQTPSETGVAIPQIQYQDTGLIVEGSSMPASQDGMVDIRLSIEMSGIDTSSGKLTPTFMTRSLKNVVRMRLGESALPIGLIQQEPPTPPSDSPAPAGAPSLSRGSFIVLLSTKPVQ